MVTSAEQLWMVAMEVSLTPELEKRIAEKVGTGLYDSASEVVRESLRLLFSAEDTRARRLDQLHADIRIGLEELDSGEGIPGDRAFAEVTAFLENRRRP
jgi:antitoxin ParD1/3/4